MKHFDENIHWLIKTIITKLTRGSIPLILFLSYKVIWIRKVTFSWWKLIMIYFLYFLQKITRINQCTQTHYCFSVLLSFKRRIINHVHLFTKKLISISGF